MAERSILPSLAPAADRIKARNERLASLRERAGLSMDDLAKEMGFKGQSSIQRYLNLNYEKGFRPELVTKFKAALVGRGEPPISPSELSILDNWAETADGTTIDLMSMLLANFDAGQPMEAYYKQVEELGLPRDTSSIASTLLQARRSKFLGADNEKTTRVAGLPLLEGDVVLKLPRYISEESAETLRSWIDHMISLTLRKPEVDSK